MNRTECPSCGVDLRSYRSEVTRLLAEVDRLNDQIRERDRMLEKITERDVAAAVERRQAAI